MLPKIIQFSRVHRRPQTKPLIVWCFCGTSMFFWKSVFTQGTHTKLIFVILGVKKYQKGKWLITLFMLYLYVKYFLYAYRRQSEDDITRQFSWWTADRNADTRNSIRSCLSVYLPVSFYPGMESNTVAKTIADRLRYRRQYRLATYSVNRDKALERIMHKHSPSSSLTDRLGRVF